MSRARRRASHARGVARAQRRGHASDERARSGERGGVRARDALLRAPRRRRRRATRRARRRCAPSSSLSAAASIERGTNRSLSVTSSSAPSAHAPLASGASRLTLMPRESARTCDAAPATSVTRARPPRLSRALSLHRRLGGRRRRRRGRSPSSSARSRPRSSASGAARLELKSACRTEGPNTCHGPATSGACNPNTRHGPATSGACNFWCLQLLPPSATSPSRQVRYGGRSCKKNRPPQKKDDSDRPLS